MFVAENSGKLHDTDTDPGIDIINTDEHVAFHAIKVLTPMGCAMLAAFLHLPS